MTPRELLAAFDVLADAPNGVKRLRELVLQLAVRGKLVPQDPSDEPASVLLQRIADEKARAISAGEAPTPRALPEQQDAPPLFGLPEAWTWTRIDDVTSYVQRGRSPKYDDSSPVRVVSQKCIQWSGFDLSKSRGIQGSSLEEYGPERLLRDGDLLWNSTGTGTVGRVGAFRPSPDTKIAVADSHVTVLRPAIMEPRFLLAWLSGPTVQDSIAELTTGTTKQQELATSTVRAHPVPLPPLAEQRRIVARVDELMALLDRLEAARSAREATRTAARDSALAALREADTADDVELAWQRIAERMDDLFTEPPDIEPLREAALQLAVRGRLVRQDLDERPRTLIERTTGTPQKVKSRGGRRGMPPDPPTHDAPPFSAPTGWIWCRLEQLASNLPRSIQSGPFGSSLRHSEFVPEGVLVIGIDNVQDGWFSPGSDNRIPPAKYELLKKYRARPRDLLITVMATVGRCCLVPDDIEPAIVTKHVYRITLNPVLALPRYLLHIIRKAPVMQNQMFDQARGGTRDGLNGGIIKGLLVPLPPIGEQARIVAKLDELMALLDRLEQRLAAKVEAHDAFAAAAVHHLDTESSPAPAAPQPAATKPARRRSGSQASVESVPPSA